MPNQTPTTSHFLRYYAENTPQAPAVVLDRQVVSMDAFYRIVCACTGAVAGLELPAGSVVAIDSEDLVEHWALALALENNHLCSMSVRTVEVALPEAMDAATCLLTRQPQGGGCRLPWHAVGEGPLALDGDKQRAGAALIDSLHWPVDEAVRVIRTSGTTGRPQRMLQSRGMLEGTVRNFARFNAFTAASRALNQYPFSIAASYMAANASLRAGGAVVRSALPLPQALLQHQITHFGQLPYDLHRLLAELPPDFPFQPGLRLMLGGGAVSQDVLDQVRGRLTRNICNVYGTNEVGMVASAEITDADNHVVTPWPGVQAQVVDSQGHPAPAGEFGRLVLRSSSMSEGYLGDARATAAGFQQGWFLTSDIARMVRNGEALELAGRTDEVINIGGLKIQPEHLEALLRGLAGVGDVGVAALAQDAGGQAALIALVTTQPDTLERARKLVDSQLAALAPLMRLAEVEYIPRTDTGKVKRSALAELVRP